MYNIFNLKQNEITLFDSNIKIQKQQMAETGFQRINNPEKYKNTETTIGSNRFSKKRKSTQNRSDFGNYRHQKNENIKENKRASLDVRQAVFDFIKIWSDQFEQNLGLLVGDLFTTEVFAIKAEGE